MKRLLPLLAIVSASADTLPSIGKQPWVAQYAAYERKDFHFSVNSEGEAELVPIDEKGKPVSSRYAIKFRAVVEDTSANGKVFNRAIVKDGWEAVTPAAVDPEKVTYRGTVTGEARFEVNFEFDGNEIRAGGRLIETGKLAKPRFLLRVQIPNIYYYDKDPKKLEEKTKRDRIDLVRTDGKKLKLDVLKALDAESAEIGGPGVAQARIEMAGYRGHRIELAAGATGLFEFWNHGIAPLREGFTFGWVQDPAKDPDGKARLTLLVR